MTIEVVFDGEVFRPEQPVDLLPNTRYRVTLAESGVREPERDAWTVLEELAGTIDAPEGWSSAHDNHLYEGPQREKPKS